MIDKAKSFLTSEKPSMMSLIEKFNMSEDNLNKLKNQNQNIQDEIDKSSIVVLIRNPKLIKLILKKYENK